jgi:demethylmenaquinone methyltransferase/2-methoxy-6-polyprenyl-1,4-benzoquinol methylase
MIARKFPDCQITGVDVMEEYLAIAKEKARIRNMSNLEFILGRAEDVLIDQSFDCIISSYLAKYADLKRLISNAGKMLHKGGMLIMHDFTYPANRFSAPVWRFYFLILQKIGARIYPQWKPAFDGLPGLLQEVRWVENLVQCLKQEGFSDISVESLTLGTAAIVTAKK